MPEKTCGNCVGWIFVNSAHLVNAEVCLGDDRTDVKNIAELLGRIRGRDQDATDCPCRKAKEKP